MKLQSKLTPNIRFRVKIGNTALQNQRLSNSYYIILHTIFKESFFMREHMAKICESWLNSNPSTLVVRFCIIDMEGKSNGQKKAGQSTHSKQ